LRREPAFGFSRVAEAQLGDVGVLGRCEYVLSAHQNSESREKNALRIVSRLPVPGQSSSPSRSRAMVRRHRRAMITGSEKSSQTIVSARAQTIGRTSAPP
jgi:hypothetical protein